VVYVVDDDRQSIWLIEQLLQGIGVECLGFTSALQFLDSYSPRPSECLICDLRMPEFGGLEVQKRLMAKEASLPMIFVSGYPEISTAVAAIKTGAFDFLEKPINGATLISRVQEALVLSRTLHAERMDRTTRDARLGLLTEKERQVAERVIAGRSSREIAEEMNLSARTIENHRSSVMRKLRADSLADLIKFFL
jgi:FixJ family two-component response regulator